MIGVLEESASGAERKIQENDMVIVYERFDNMKAVKVTLEGIFNNSWGMYPTKVCESVAWPWWSQTT